MSIAQLPNQSTYQLQPSDADLLQRLRIALSVHRRAGWHLVNFTAQNGVVQLTGVVPTFYDRQLIAALVRHVAGVFGIKDNLTVGDPSIRQQVIDSETTVLKGISKLRDTPPSVPFRHLPVLTETLHDVLAGTGVGVLRLT